MKLVAAGASGTESTRVSRRLLLAAAVLAVGVGIGAGAAVHALLRSPSAQSRSPLSAAGSVELIRHGLYGVATWAPGAVAAPNIRTLHDQNGHRFALSSLHGRTVAVVFFDSYCHQECPLEGRQLAVAERRLPAAQRPDLVVVSVNPKDTPASAARAMHEWGLAGLAPWHWLMGTHRQLARVWAAYRIQVSPPVNGDINHTEALYLLDRRGYERAGFLWPFASRFATADLRALATGRTA